MAHETEAVVFHDVCDASRFHPLVDFSPRAIVGFESARNLKERNTSALKYACNFRHRAGLAPGQPFACHPATIPHPVERGIVHSCTGSKVQNDQWRFRTPDNGQNCGREAVRCGVEEYEVDVCPAKLMTGCEGLFGCIDQAEIFDMTSALCQTRGDLPVVIQQALSEAGELGPIRLQTEAE